MVLARDSIRNRTSSSDRFAFHSNSFCMEQCSLIALPTVSLHLATYYVVIGNREVSPQKMCTYKLCLFYPRFPHLNQMSRGSATLLCSSTFFHRLRTRSAHSSCSRSRTSNTVVRSLTYLPVFVFHARSRKVPPTCLRVPCEVEEVPPILGNCHNSSSVASWDGACPSSAAYLALPIEASKLNLGCVSGPTYHPGGN